MLAKIRTYQAQVFKFILDILHYLISFWFLYKLAFIT